MNQGRSSQPAEHRQFPFSKAGEREREREGEGEGEGEGRREREGDGERRKVKEKREREGEKAWYDYRETDGSASWPSWLHLNLGLQPPTLTLLAWPQIDVTRYACKPGSDLF